MKFTVVFALLLIAAQAHGAALKGIAKNAPRHDHPGKRQMPTLPVQVTPPSPPPPSPTPSPSPAPPPPSTPPVVQSSSITINPLPTPSSSPAPEPTIIPSNTPTQDTPSMNSYTVPPTNSYVSSPSNAPSSSFSNFVSTYVTTFSGSVITTKKTRTAPAEATDTGSSSATESSAANSNDNRSSSSSGSNAGVIVGGVVAGVLVVFGLILITVRLFKRNNRLDRRSKALATEIERGLDVNPPRSSGPTGPSMVHRQFVPPTENADEYQYRPAEYDAERYYQNAQAQQAASSPLQAHQSRPFSPTLVPYSHDVLPPPQHQGHMNHMEAAGHEPRTEANITHAYASSSPSMRPPSVPPYPVTNPNQYKPNELNDTPGDIATMGRKPDVVDY